MIDRKALWICFLLVIVMTAAPLWRLSLLPDWHHVPLNGPDDSHTMPVFRMFLGPLVLLLMIGLIYARKCLRSGPEEAIQPWRRFNGLTVVFAAAMMAVMQAFMLARSLDALQSIDRLTVSHVVFVVAGIFMMAIGNRMPKMPWLMARFRPLDPWQWNQHLRFAGRLMVVFGLFWAVGMPLLPVRLMLPGAISLTVAMAAVSFWHRAKVRRQPSPLL